MPIFASGTKTFFRQTSAPTGWTKDTTHNDAALRVVSGAASTGGSVAFSSTFGSSQTFTNAPFPMSSLGSFTLAGPNINPHGHVPGATGPRGMTTSLTAPGSATTPSPLVNRVGALAGSTSSTGNAGGASGHAHPVTLTVSGSVADLGLRYVDVILASKD